mmetsp:Transcript_13428/g.32755  ORF Transcript_13428/g.32755 Transcript_13428/m.32755 type:complete len:358 (-) Transcript_13428:344-1417(-)
MPGKGWTVSYSAPSFFPKDEQDEKDNLPPEEHDLIEKELHGLDVFDFETYEQQLNGQEADPTRSTTSGKCRSMLNEMDECLKWLDELDPELTSEYRQALEKVPRLVKKETPSVMFLRAEHYDIEGAARRLAMHWKERVSLFGVERAFKPMTIQPDGALGCDAIDMEQLMLGYVARVPDDLMGRPVVWLDRSGSTKSPTYKRDCWLRVMWYLVHVICLEDKYQKSGYVVVINLKDYNPAKCGDRLGAKKMFLYVRECWCPRFKGYHATYSSRQTPVKLVEPAIRKMQGRHIRLHLRNHYGFDSDNIQAMEEFGLGPQHVSTTIGGTFTNNNHLEWVYEQQRLEQEQEEQEEQQQQEEC